MIVRNTPRWYRSILSTKAQTGVLAVYALNPKQTGLALWRFAVLVEGEFHLIGKKGLPSRDEARSECHKRYNQAVKEQRAQRRAA